MTPTTPINTSHPKAPDPRHRRSTLAENDFKRLPGLSTYLVLALWITTIMAAIGTGIYEDGGNPPIALMATVTAPILAVTVAYFNVSTFRSYLLELDLRLVVAAQLWRVVGIAFLFALAFGQLPAGFAIPAGIGDIATGIAALGATIALSNATLTKGRLYAFTALGVGDFLAAIITGLSLRPPELDLWPLIIFPTLMVPFFAVLHLISVLQTRHHWKARVEKLGRSAR